MSYAEKEKEYRKELKEFFRKRLEFTYYQISEKTNNKCRQPNIFRMMNGDNFLESVKNCIIEYKSGLHSLKPYGKEVIALSFEAILYENKDYQKLYDKDEIKGILEACEFALKQVNYFD